MAVEDTSLPRIRTWFTGSLIVQLKLPDQDEPREHETALKIEESKVRRIWKDFRDEAADRTFTGKENWLASDTGPTGTPVEAPTSTSPLAVGARLQATLTVATTGVEKASQVTLVAVMRKRRWKFDWRVMVPEASTVAAVGTVDVNVKRLVIGIHDASEVGVNLVPSENVAATLSDDTSPAAPAKVSDDKLVERVAEDIPTATSRTLTESGLEVAPANVPVMSVDPGSAPVRIVPETLAIFGRVDVNVELDVTSVRELSDWTAIIES